MGFGRSAIAGPGPSATRSRQGATVVLAVLAVLGAFALVVTLVVAPRAELRSPAVAMVRVLVPTWRFFDTVGEHPRLWARTMDHDGTPGHWRPLLGPPERAWWNVAWHPQGNLSLAGHSLLDRLLSDIAHRPDADPSSLVTYRLVLDQVRFAADAVGAHGVQFKLTAPGPAAAPSSAAEPGPDLFVSAVHAP